MIFSIALLIVIVFLAFKAAPVEKKEHALLHGAGQIGLLAALALFGVDYFTSYFYATGEMMTALHPYNLQKYAFIAVSRDRLCQLRFWFPVHVFSGDFQRRRRFVHRLDALSGSRAEPGGGGRPASGLHFHHCSLQPFRRGSIAIPDQLI